ncbi:hypothetical protein GCM10022280_15530 [Sphingomonas swuensis]|uniref:Phage shock protein B n=1 Tax=Sphingomonas swuensis TaxID=977800 RepID=A0ABP7SW26_9SPHN
MNPFEMLLLLVGMVLIFQLIKHKTTLRHERRSHDIFPLADDPDESRMLRDEVRQLKERIQVLERITVEKENSLAREIEDLRNR